MNELSAECLNELPPEKAEDICLLKSETVPICNKWYYAPFDCMVCVSTEGHPLLHMQPFLVNLKLMINWKLLYQ